ncbi:MAG: hypothetical protein KatS3mg105_1245 [Gemmatales bacterium]|nr:MAG: hypothetical protein KatS3mg105_1245 [Gemmatales bacterium]
MARFACNVTCDIYRGFAASAPYPLEGTPAAVAGVRALLKHHLQNGRFGFASGSLKWTHVLVLDKTIDIRSAYQAWPANPIANANADTVLIRDYPLPGQCTAFVVVMVEIEGDQRRAYLDRLQPRRTGCFVPGVQEACGNCTILPANWRLKTAGDFIDNGCSNCSSLNGGTWTLLHDGGCHWRSATFPPVCSTGLPAGNVRWHLRFEFGIGWKLSLDSPLVEVVAFDPIAAADFICAGPNTFVNPTWWPGTCSSSSPVTIERSE